MRFLYLSCHSILEYDEVSLLMELGHHTFSPGAYVEPRNKGDATLRPGLQNLDPFYDRYMEDLEAWNQIVSPPADDRKYHLTKEFVDRFDAVIVMHIPDFIRRNWDAIKHKPVVWRTIGQSISDRERELAPYRAQGMKIMRYSPKERTIPGYLGEDWMIRFYKDPEEFKGWTGQTKEVLTFNQSVVERRQACNGEFYEKATQGVPRALYGPGNDGLRGAKGKVPFEQLKQAMREYACYLYLGTHPASYTLNFIEAMMTGIPMAVPGPRLGNAIYFPGHDLYEAHEIIQGVGHVVDNPVLMKTALMAMLRAKPSEMQTMSDNARQRAIELFGKPTIKSQWAQFISNLEKV